MEKELVTLSVFLTLTGQELLAKGQPLFAWNFTVARLPPDGETTDCLGHAPAPAEYLKLGELVVELPSREACLPNVLAHLDKGTAEIYAESEKAVAKIRQRREELLALPAPSRFTNLPV